MSFVRVLGMLVVSGLSGLTAQYALAAPTQGAGTFDSFVLAMSHENDFCDTKPGKDECRQGAGSFGMALHGLWPNRDNDPQHRFQYCGTVTANQLEGKWCAARYDVRGDLTDDTYEGLSDVMPGVKSCLYNHEWYAHGTCSGSTADEFFDQSQKLAKGFLGLARFNNLMKANEGKTVSRAQLVDALVADLGQGSEDSFLLNCRKDGAKPARSHFSEVDITLDRKNFLVFPAAGSLARAAGSDRGNCPAEGIVITAASK